MEIPSKKAPNLPVRHVDTDILRGMLDETEEDDLWQIGRHLRNTITSSKPLGVSIPAIGEAFLKLSEAAMRCEDGACEAAAGRLRKLVQQGKLVPVGVGNRTNNAFEIAQKIMKVDYRVTPVDALILSVACQSEYCNELITTDGVLNTSIKVKEMAHRDYRVRIKSP